MASDRNADAGSKNAGPKLALVPSVLDALRPGASTGVGSLPHRDAKAAAEFALREYELLALPSLPRRSPAEAMVAQALIGIPGVTLGQYGSIAVDIDAVDPESEVHTDVSGDSFLGLRQCLDMAAERNSASDPIKWQFVGPVTLGVALVRAGVPTDIAFEMAAASVRSHLRAISAYVAEVLPGAPQLVIIDEPWLVELMSEEFPIAPDHAVDLMSSAMAALGPGTAAGVHCCGPTDWASVIAAGPQVLSVPASSSLESVAGYLQRFLDEGGWVAWGVVATGGPIGVTAGRAWHHLSGVWCGLVQLGVDPALLRRQALLTPHCGLGTHTPAIAERVCRTVREITHRVRDQASATRFVLGA
jgi:methionine synthase II (cobalamin-independent)